jgi:hypothetical protein
MIQKRRKTTGYSGKVKKSDHSKPTERQIPVVIKDPLI